MKEIISKITKIVCDTSGINEKEFDAQGDLHEKYNIPSVDIIQVLIIMEKEFQIEFEEADMVLDNFRNVNAMGELVERKMCNDKGTVDV